VITAETRRRWSSEGKRAIVEEAARTTTSVSEVARRHGIASSLLFRWRREFADADRKQVAPAGLPARQDRSSGRIEIELAGGRRIRVDAAVDVGVLKQIIDALEGQ
jgi:transposase